MHLSIAKTPVEEVIDMDSLRTFQRTQTKLPSGVKKRSFTDYFTGPRDMNHFSKWPFFFRLHGSITPKMILPLFIIGTWATIVTVVYTEGQKACGPPPKENEGDFYKPKATDKPGYCRALHKLDPILISVLGFVVALALSFRSTTAYERYMEGRRFWGQLTTVSQNLARIVWVHAKEREGHEKEDLLEKITFLNLIIAFSHAFKHKLRYEPYIYEDLRNVRYLNTFASQAKAGINVDDEERDPAWQRIGQFLGVAFAENNPRAAIKKASVPLGNLTLEIMVHLQSYVDKVIDSAQLKAPAAQMNCVNGLNTMSEIVTGCDRILSTPLPLAYSIAITQITWAYLILLPLQLFNKLEWFTIPATILAAYIILGMALIGSEVENPFGQDVNDLPLDGFCDQIASDLAIISSSAPPKAAEVTKRAQNLPLYPLSMGSYEQWADRSEQDIRDALRSRVYVGWRAGAAGPSTGAPSTPEPWT